MNAATLPPALAEATEHQPSARVALAAALRSPSHSYLFLGPAGAGKRAAARAFVAELIAEGAPDPESARRRALADPTPHPDLVWLRPPGTQHLVEEVRERVIAAAAYRPFEGERRAFVIEAAETMAEESQNALLKTLEEPAPGMHLVLISAEPEALLETVRSRCVPVRFSRLAPEAVEEELAALEVPAAERRATARLAGGDPNRARVLAGAEGRELRQAAERFAEATRSGNLGPSPWLDLLRSAEAAGERAAGAVRAQAAQAEEEASERTPAATRRRAREADETARRVERSVRIDALDAGLALLGAWLRDLAAVAEGAEALALNTDRADQLREQANGLEPRRARRAAELVMETRRRLQVNVNETLALEALAFRLEFLLAR